MAHEVESMFYYEQVPWHKLGRKVTKALTAEEAIEAAGLNWTVELRDAYVQSPVAPTGVELIEGRKAVVRQHDGVVYGVVSDAYQPIQNAEAFTFFDAVVNTGKVRYETAGSLRYGARVWILAKMKSPLSVAGDRVDRYITLLNSHDGTSALQLYWTPVRVVCMNTLQMSQTMKLGRTFYARHTAGATDRVRQAQEVLGLADSYYADWLEEAEQLAKVKISDAEAARVVLHALGQDGNMDLSKQTQKSVDQIMELRYTGKGLDSQRVRGTAWQVYNAIVEFADYYRIPRSNDPSARLNSVWFGTGAQIKQRAWDASLSLSMS